MDFLPNHSKKCQDPGSNEKAFVEECTCSCTYSFFKTPHSLVSATAASVSGNISITPSSIFYATDSTGAEMQLAYLLCSAQIHFFPHLFIKHV